MASDVFTLAIGTSNKETSVFNGVVVQVEGDVEDTSLIDHFNFYEGINEKFNSTEELSDFLKELDESKAGELLNLIAPDSDDQLKIKVTSPNAGHDSLSLSSVDQVWAVKDFPFSEDYVNSKGEEDIEMEIEDSDDYAMTWDIDKKLTMIVVSENTPEPRIPFKK